MLNISINIHTSKDSLEIWDLVRRLAALAEGDGDAIIMEASIYKIEEDDDDGDIDTVFVPVSPQPEYSDSE